MALGQHRTILQIVGYQNSGKTTLAEKLISYACNKGLRVGSIKHHGHGGAPTSNLTKDSTRHAQAGAVVSAVEGDGVVQLQLAKNTCALNELIHLYEQALLVNFIIVEGYKTESYQKVVLLKEPEDVKLLTLSNIVAAIYWPTFPQALCEKIPHFALQDEAAYLSFLVTKEGC